VPRIRTLKPDHRQHRKVGPLDHFTYRLWVGLILEADDAGRLVAEPEELRVIVFAYHPRVTGEQVAGALARLAAVGLIRRYAVNGKQYADFPSFSDHQVINRPTRSKLPAHQDSLSTHGALTEHSLTEVEVEVEVEGKNLNYVGEVDAPRLRRPASKSGRIDAARNVLAWLNEKAGTHFRPAPVNLNFIRARLADGLTEWQLRAIVTTKAEQWLRDPHMRPYLRPATLFNRTKCEQYVAELTQSRPPEPPRP